MKSIRRNLIITYSAISVAIIAMLAFFFYFSLDTIFEEYAKEQQADRIESVRKQLIELYDEETGKFDVAGMEIIGNAALQNGLILHVQTANQEIDWDINTHKNEECQMMLEHADQNMHSKYPNFTGGYKDDKYDLSIDGETVGFMTVGYYGPYSLDDNELHMLNTINKRLIGIGGVSLLIAIFLGIVMSRRITAPISSAIQIARKIAEGEYGVQSDIKSKNAETNSLIMAINEMSFKLQMDEKQKKQITSDVAHELRTPLTNLQGNLEAMLDGIWEPDRERLMSCHEEIARLAGIVRQMQELYSLENKGDELEYEEIGFLNLCKSLLMDFAGKLREKQIHLACMAGKDDVVWGDEHRIRQCMINLISNAIQYSDEGSDICISFKQGESGAIIKVEDHGIGIPEEELPHLFERFYRVDKSRNKKTGGLGIGLSITKAIVERHNGKITVESVFGKGTTFTMKFPAKKAESHW